MKRWLFLAYGVACYGLFQLTALGMLAFLAGFSWPKSIDGPVESGFAAALMANISLVVLFGLQHSVMARPGFKAWWTRIVPKSIERSTYLLVTCVVTGIVLALWQPMPTIVWDVRTPALRMALWALFACGWMLVVAATYMLDHFDLFGLRQVWTYYRSYRYAPPEYREPMLYRHIRHPIYVGWAIAFWATPTMTIGHLIWAIGMSVYMGVAVVFEERDLLKHFGERYADYRRRVPAFVPGWKRIRSGSGSSVTEAAPAYGSPRATRREVGEVEVTG